MKQIAEAIKHQDTVKLSLISQSYPDKKPEPLPQKAIDVFNDLFKQLRATFPAMIATIKDQEHLNELRRQWVKAIAENEIFHQEQIEAGMRMARRHDKPFLPSPGEFISWCKAGEGSRFNLPTASELFESVMRYKATHFQYRTPEDYPWESDAEYWLVTTVSAKMSNLALSVNESIKVCDQEIRKIARKLSDGIPIQKPVPQLEKKFIPSTPEVAQRNIANIKAMFKSHR